MFERFTDRARRVLVLAQEAAAELNHSFIGTEHILLGLIDEEDGLAAKALTSLEISPAAVRAEVEAMIGLGVASQPTGPPPFTPRAKKVLELALREALQLGHNYIGTEHMLLGIAREGDGVGAQVLISLGADLATVRQQVLQELSGYAGPRTQLSSPERRRFDRASAVGDSWSLEVVRAGRGPETLAAAYDRLRELVTQLGSTLDEARVRVTSVDTPDGPGLRLTIRHWPGPAEPEMDI